MNVSLVMCRGLGIILILLLISLVVGMFVFVIVIVMIESSVVRCVVKVVILGMMVI